MLKHFILVNLCETLEELSEAIIIIGNQNNVVPGKIMGRSQDFDAKKMAKACLNLTSDSPKYHFNVLTRNYGIRQQALYILKYQ